MNALVQPLASCFNYFLGLLSVLPLPFRAFLSLAIVLLGITIIIKVVRGH